MYFVQIYLEIWPPFINQIGDDCYSDVLKCLKEFKNLILGCFKNIEMELGLLSFYLSFNIDICTKTAPLILLCKT